MGAVGVSNVYAGSSPSRTYTKTFCRPPSPAISTASLCGFGPGPASQSFDSRIASASGALPSNFTRPEIEPAVAGSTFLPGAAPGLASEDFVPPQAIEPTPTHTQDTGK